MSSTKSSSASAGIVRAIIGAGLFAWGFAAFAHGPALAARLQEALGLTNGPAVGLAFGLELAAVLAGMALMEPLLARLLRRD